jgi:hypothetical protein
MIGFTNHFARLLFGFAKQFAWRPEGRPRRVKIYVQ